ncbi:MAG: methyltransferase domain-containing protein [Elusimicrobia bacterium]|nr:methyltransferase domain-containing protein [Elusimicrobiota bacterium]
MTPLLAALLLALSPTARAEGNSGSEFTFAVMGCAHLGMCGPEGFAKAVESMKSHRPEFVLLLGDMVDAVGESAEEMEPVHDAARAVRRNVRLPAEAIEARWREFDRIAATLGVPVYDVPGGRSIPPNNVEAAERAFLKRHKARYRSFEHKNSLFVLLDSEYHNRTDLRLRGVVDGAQLEFLKRTLASSAHENVFVAMHKPAWIIRADPRWRDDVHSSFTGKVRYVFGAGQHVLDAATDDGVGYVTTGSGGCGYSDKSPGSFPHYLLVTVRGSKVDVRTVPLEPVGIDAWFMARGRSEEGKVQMLDVQAGLMRAPEVLERIEPKPGMTIADIGAGTGIFALPLARALKGEGRVYATDVDPVMVELLKRKGVEAGLPVLVPVLVTASGVDPFYLKQSFDVILLSNVYELLDRPKEYFAALAPALAKGSGRLYVINRRYDPDFTEYEFARFDETSRVLATTPSDHPILHRFSEGVLSSMRARAGEEPAAETLTAFVGEINAMLADPRLFVDTADYYSQKRSGLRSLNKQFVHPMDQRLAQRLVMELYSGKRSIENGRPLSKDERLALRALNRIILMGFLRARAVMDRFRNEYNLFASEDETVSTMESAGLRFVRSHAVLPYHYMLEFKRQP